MSPAPRRAAFLDRDGTVIVDRGYLGDAEGVELLPGAAEAIARLNRAGVPAILVTNQSGVGRGYFPEENVHAVQRRLEELLEREGARLDGAYFCPHAPDDGCECRKPLPGLFERAAREHGLELRGSFFVGDRPRDVEPAAALGGHGVVVATGPESAAPPPGTPVVGSLGEAVDLVLARLPFD